MSYPRILARVLGSPWAITPTGYRAILTTLDSRIGRRAEHDYPDEPPDRPEKEKPEPLPPYAMVAPGVALVSASGIMGNHLSSMESMCGGLSVEALGDAIDMAASDPGVGAIILNLDTPGGVISGIPELHAQIRELSAAGVKVIAFCDSLTASAGYWTIAAADAIYVTESADIGSIGVYCALIDETGAFEKQGLKAEVFTTGVFKAMGFPGTSLTDDQRAHLQASVDEAFVLFKRDVRAARPKIPDSSMQGQCFMGASAVAAGLADGVVRDLDALLLELTTTIVVAVGS